MHTPLSFPDLLRLIDERTTAFIAAVGDLDAPVPTCPGWTVFDLVQHLGDGRRKWAEIVAAGPSDTPPARTPAQAPREGLAEWMAESTRLLIAALEAAGPDQGCWNWWGDSQSPPTVATAARRQLHEIAAHTYDAQLAAGAPEPIPAEIAVDGVDEFLMTCFSTSSPWPHEPAIVDYHVTEGGLWRISMSADGARVVEPGDGAADASAEGSAHDFLMVFYGRGSLEPLKLDGAVHVLDQLGAWVPA
ncbi:maleylpyruvate isomerase family mycothiol-dependent enzyme [Lentzea jiangxiensis]|uniref:TIGR03083 family protein n=1 Tax=Lentzea jiangxiensis TaxID=641025 RepID=A0A1H0PPE5_9PSEU|nr:maleylpyruvate isomerase family mycothiol-dependent enzyme [Lentzea jiangxiensis]SDP06864.1 TIGR03083 family protein [Lentzea jiangxiensis]